MARDVLLDYVVKVQAVEPILPASRAYLHNVMVIVKPKSGTTEGIYLCEDRADVEALTDAKAWQLLEAGMSKIYLCVAETFSSAETLLNADTTYKYFTILEDTAFTAPHSFTGFKGVKGWANSDRATAKAFEVIATEDNTAFVEPSSTFGANMYWAFGKLLSGLQWKNQQYIPMPEVGATSSLGTAEQYFEDRLSFVLNSEEFGNRLAFFANRGRAIVAPYIYEEFTLDLQSWALIYINTNQPDYNDLEASKLQGYLLKKANEKYVASGMVEQVTVAIRADQDNFIMSGNIAVAEPKATWRIQAQLQEGGLNG